MPPAVAAALPGLATLTLLGNAALLDAALPTATAFFCSVQCPGSLILQSYDLAQAWRSEGRAVISGFHTPIEQSVLTILLRGKGPLLICPARSLSKMRLPVAWRPALDAGRLLLLSPFADAQHRATQALADQRNRLVAALAAEVCIAYAAPEGKTAALAQNLLAQGRRVTTLDSVYNQHLIDIGAVGV
jgi:predicted Rossmann fold nucleotide-binding protein DprA/Smf involved in DNA uptake